MAGSWSSEALALVLQLCKMWWGALSLRSLWCGPHRKPILGRCICTAGAENPLGGKTARPLILDSTITLQVMFWKGLRVSVRSLQAFCTHVQGPDQVSLFSSGIVIASI